ncbi:MAG: calcium/proton exchanger [Synechococcaceae cyanobacterium]|jgi:Ca2+:H+ antiporter|nr:calcium/proton exchanger [Synechococcaceae cyanobacterium]
MSSRLKVSLGLLLMLPLSLLAEQQGWGEAAVCLTSVAAIVPLAIWLSTATEELGVALGPAAGGLLNAVFGNATELILALAALRAGLVTIVKASITGTLIGNLLLTLGLAMLVGGIGRREQTFQPAVARVGGTAMSLAVLAILLPTLATLGLDPADLPAALLGEQGFSQFVASLLLVVYGLTLLYTLGTHSGLFQPAESGAGSDREAQPPPHKPPLLPWLAVLLGATVGLAIESELFMGVVEPVSANLGLSPGFTGVVLLPLLGGLPEYVTAVSLARANKMDLSVSVAFGSTLLVALLMVPVLVLSGPLLGHPIDLGFSIYEIVAVATAVVVANLVSLDGRSDWLEGVLLLAAYLILAAGFWFQTGAA